MEIMEKEGFMLSVFIVTEVLSPKLYQNITGSSLPAVLFPCPWACSGVSRRCEVWTSMHPALLTHRSVINPRKSPCPSPQLLPPAGNQEQAGDQQCPGGNNMKMGNVPGMEVCALESLTEEHRLQQD